MKKLKLDFQGLNAEVLSRTQMKTIFGGVLSGGGGECSTSVTCSGGGTISCSSNGAAGNTQGGDSCQKLQQVLHAMILGLQTIGVIVIVKESINLPRFKVSI